MSSKLTTLQADVKALLEADTLFSGTPIPVLTENLKDIASDIDVALGVIQPPAGSTKAGACAIVLTPDAVASHPNVPGPYFDETEGLVRIVENVTINRATGGTLQTALAIAEAAAHALHHALTSDKKTILVNRIRLVPDEVALMYDVVFRTEVGL